MPAQLLITRPEYEAPTRYLSAWSKLIIDEAQHRGMDIIDLDREKAKRNRVLGTLQKKQTEKMLVVLNGHGGESWIRGQEEVILTTADVKNLLNKIIYARACSSAKELGPQAVAAGALAYIGYDIEFAMYIEEGKVGHPLEDRTAALFMEPANYVASSLIKGHPAGEANRRSRKKFAENIQKIIIEGAKSPYYYTISVLYDNMVHQVCLGSNEAKI